MIHIKDSLVLVSLFQVKYDTTLVNILTELDIKYPDHVVITCGYRKGDKGVHGSIPCRGVDIRSWVFKNPVSVCNYINSNWEYDFNRPEKFVALLHTAGSGTHIHLQTHPNTRRRLQWAI